MLRILILGISIVLFATTRVNGLKLFTFPVKSFGRYRKVQLKYCNYFPSRNKQRFLRNVISLELSSLWGVEKQTNKSSGNVASVVTQVPGGDGHGAQVQVVPDGVLEVVVHPALREPRVEVLPQVARDRT